MKLFIKLILSLSAGVSFSSSSAEWQLTDNSVSILDKENGYFITTDNNEKMTIIFKQSCDGEPTGPVRTELEIDNDTLLSAISHCDANTHFKAIVPGRAAREYIQMLLRSGLAVVIEDKYIPPHNYKESIKEINNSYL